MSKARPTLVTFLLDRSGSMFSIQASTIEAFNAYLAELRKGKSITFSFLQFDSISIDTVVKNVDPKAAPDLSFANFQPRGGTPLIDAAVKTIRAVEEALTRRDDNPKVAICFQTDGQENESREFTWEVLSDLIKEKTKAGWDFSFMGASIDAYQQGSRMGISSVNTVSYDAADLSATRAAFSARGSNTADFASGMLGSTAYSAEQKLASGDKFDPALKAPPVTPKPGPKKAIVDDVKL